MEVQPGNLLRVPWGISAWVSSRIYVGAQPRILLRVTPEVLVAVPSGIPV